MRHIRIPLAETKSFSNFFLDYISRKDSLAPFYEIFPEPRNFNELLTRRQHAFPAENRRALTLALSRQYADLDVAEKVRNNISALEDAGTFTVTTGHQLNIFTGPLYFIYKIVTTINACKTLASQYPQYRFVPVYWMASEDHDFEEISYFRLYGKKYVWHTDQKGAVGRFSPKGLAQLLKEIPGETAPFEKAYLKQKTLASAVRYYVNELFGAEGLVVIDGDDRELKSLFRNVMEEDLTKNSTLGIVNRTNEKLESLGYKTQVYCRDINFFYLDDGVRARIERTGDVYRVVDTDLTFPQNDIKKIIAETPEKLSPNVILRPLYQEVILPNIAYVGGPAEVVYWLQLRDVFQHYQVPFPALLPRNFAMIMDHTIQRKLSKTGVALETFFESKNYIFNDWTLKNTRHDLSVDEQLRAIRAEYDSLQKQALSVDPTLGPFVGAQAKRAIDGIEKIAKKLLRAEKRNHSDKLRQIEEVKDALFPGGGLQERTDNFLNFYQQDGQFINSLLKAFDPFDFSFNVLIYNGNEESGASKNIS